MKKVNNSFISHAINHQNLEVTNQKVYGNCSDRHWEWVHRTWESTTSQDEVRMDPEKGRSHWCIAPSIDDLEKMMLSGEETMRSSRGRIGTEGKMMGQLKGWNQRQPSIHLRSVTTERWRLTCCPRSEAIGCRRWCWGWWVRWLRAIVLAGNWKRSIDKMNTLSFWVFL